MLQMHQSRLQKEFGQESVKMKDVVLALPQRVDFDSLDWMKSRLSRFPRVELPGTEPIAKVRN